MAKILTYDGKERCLKFAIDLVASNDGVIYDASAVVETARIFEEYITEVDKNQHVYVYNDG